MSTLTLAEMAEQSPDCLPFGYVPTSNQSWNDTDGCEERMQGRNTVDGIDIASEGP